MPAFGNPDPAAGVDIVHVTNGRAFEAYHAELQRQRMDTAEEPEAITELSEATKVYIYSVGAWPQEIPGASTGVKWVPALDEDKVLKHGDLSVSAPLIVLGVPSEPYPGDGEAKRIYHKPKKTDPLRRHTGLHLAKEYIGAGAQSKPDNDLTRFGVFVSLQPEQPRPGPNATPEQIKAFKLWEQDVNGARAKLAKTYNQMCGKATAAWKRGTFQSEFMDRQGGLSDERIFVVTRILGKTKVECPFLENSTAATENRPCIAECGAILPIGSLICGSCKERQVSDEVYEREMKKRRGGADQAESQSKRTKAN